ncbi:serine/threonine-protein phosphatase [Seongchinamella sediminis]|uniref:Serine/threonine-protein phosphatase n=1 Tax=Seongchinamella sediminis TaxID=2283635 RepID=A0A3L7DXS7_9GAMM|nr:protein phosphatase 2C domain-containing protein [Seongchinamella sediminis]RLQ22397.1 serine/threonine-protein phosphatase [Seongchinamella sediminis]
MRAFSADSHPGHRRSHNEDCYRANPELGLWLVADGVGGHSNGEVAAAIVRDTLDRDVARGSSLIEAIHHSHSSILQEIAGRAGSNMGSTVVALQLNGDDYEIAWVGDSRAYLFDGSSLKQVTRDHNPVSEMLARGAITPEQAANHPERNVLSQSLGVADSITVAPDRIRGTLNAGEQVLLCSDGLSDELADEDISRLMAEADDPQAQVAKLIEAALAAGGRDNITVIVVGEKAQPGQAPLARRQGDTLSHEQAVSVDNGSGHDKMVLALLGAMVLLALLWMLW